MTNTLLDHESAGRGPALLLLHSTVCDRRMWDPLVPGLAEAGYHVIRCDFRGFGQSPVATEPANDGDDVLALLDHLGVDRFTLIGSSYGGRIALETAARQPERVRALALLCAAMPGHEPSSRLLEFWHGEDALLEKGDVAGAVELNLDIWLGPDTDAAARESVRQMQRRAFDVQLARPDAPEQYPAEVDLSAITAPVLSFWGGHDLPDFREISEHLAAALPNARSVGLPWAGHLPSVERPAEILGPLLDFLRDQGSSNSAP